MFYVSVYYLKFKWLWFLLRIYFLFWYSTQHLLYVFVVSSRLLRRQCTQFWEVSSNCILKKLYKLHSLLIFGNENTFFIKVYLYSHFQWNVYGTSSYKSCTSKEESVSLSTIGGKERFVKSTLQKRFLHIFLKSILCNFTSDSKTILINKIVLVRMRHMCILFT